MKTNTFDLTQKKCGHVCFSIGKLILLYETRGRLHQKSKTGVSIMAPQKGLMSFKSVLIKQKSYRNVLKIIEKNEARYPLEIFD